MQRTENLRAGEKELVWRQIWLKVTKGWFSVLALELTQSGHAQRSLLERGTLERIFSQCSIINSSHDRRFSFFMQRDILLSKTLCFTCLLFEEGQRWKFYFVINNLLSGSFNSALFCSSFGVKVRGDMMTCLISFLVSFHCCCYL